MIIVDNGIPGFDFRGLDHIQRLGAAESAPLGRDVEMGTATVMVLPAEGSIDRKIIDNPFKIKIFVFSVINIKHKI